MLVSTAGVYLYWRMVAKPFWNGCPAELRRSDGCYYINHIQVEFSDRTSKQEVEKITKSIGGKILLDRKEAGYTNENSYLIQLPVSTESQLKKTMVQLKKDWQTQIKSVEEDVYFNVSY